jgi:hypothetical protein
MYSTSQQPQLSQQPALMSSDQAYLHMSHTIGDQFSRAQSMNYSNDQMSVQHWQNNNGQLIEQTSQMSAT